MKKLLCLSALCLCGLAAPAVAPAAPPAGEYHRRFVEFTVGPYEREWRAHEEAESLRDRGYHAEVFYREFTGWQVRAWRWE